MFQKLLRNRLSCHLLGLSRSRGKPYWLLRLMSLLNLVKNRNTGLRQLFGLNCTNTWISSSEKWAEEQCGSQRTGLSPGSQEIVSDQSSSVIMAAPSSHPLCIRCLVEPFCVPDPAEELRIQGRTGQARPLLSESLELVPRGLLQNVSRGKRAHPCSSYRQNGACLRWEPAFLQDATYLQYHKIQAGSWLLQSSVSGGVVTGTGREEGRLLLQRNCWENGKKINSREKWEAGVFHPSGL